LSFPPRSGHPTCQAWSGEGSPDGTAAPAVLAGVQGRRGRARAIVRPIAAIARELGIGESNLGDWLKKDEVDRRTRDPGRFATESAESAENRALRRRVAELEVEREILKRATTFWVKESRA